MPAARNLAVYALVVACFLGAIVWILHLGPPRAATAIAPGSSTAPPVLARILEERGLARTALGATAIACAAVDDVTAWCLLALVVAIAKAAALAGALATVVLTALFFAAMALVARPLAARLIR